MLCLNLSTIIKRRQLATISLVITTIVCYHVYSLLSVKCSCEPSDTLVIQRNTFKQKCLELETLMNKHNKLIAQIRRHFNSSTLISFNSFLRVVVDQGPEEQYEIIRRRIYFNIQELWYYIKFQLQKAINDTYYDKGRKLNLKSDMSMTEEVANRKRWILIQQEQLAGVDGHGGWRRRESASVADLVQRRLQALQNPANCRDAKKLVCEHNQGGFGCKHHHLVFCLMYAYATNRTLILKEQGWNYSNKPARGWTTLFYPLSDTCISFYNDTITNWTGPGPSDAKVVYLPILDFKKALQTKPLLLPYNIPKDLAPRISRITCDSSAWWAGQMLRYILKPRRHIQKAIYESMAKMNITDQYDLDSMPPMVGIHVRRTDKVKEASLFNIHTYMSHVVDYYAKLELTRTVDLRRVYIATDDPQVLKQAIKLYPEYSFVGDASRAQLASSYSSSRHSESALTGLLVDLHMLAMSQHVVLTFSSNYGRMVYELMQTIRADATHRFHSLDDVYYMCSSTIEPHYRSAILRNTKHPKFQIGDLIKYYYFRQGSFGKILRTKSYGPIPWYKTMEYYMTYPFPEYEEVPIYVDNTGRNLSEGSTDVTRSSFVFGLPRGALSTNSFT